MLHGRHAQLLSTVVVAAAVACASGAAVADPAPVANAVVPEHAARAHSCSQPACKDVAVEHGGAKDDPSLFVPVDVRIPIGGIAVASIEGVWLRRGPTLRNEPIMVSPIVVGDALTLSLGGRF